VAPAAKAHFQNQLIFKIANEEKNQLIFKTENEIILDQ
jgi:hypothetical protein